MISTFHRLGPRARTVADRSSTARERVHKRYTATIARTLACRNLLAAPVGARRESSIRPNLD